MAEISFYINTGEDFDIQVANSGIGFYGSSGFSDSIDVSAYQDSTYVTDANGVIEGPQANNNKFHSATGVVVNGVGPISLINLASYLSTLNIRFTHDEAVQIQNPKIRIYDRTNINLGASGVTTKVAEIIHPYVVADPNGSGDASWITPIGSSVMVDLAASPGESGWQAPANGAGSHTDTRHDWYVAISASPDSVGSKTMYGLYFQAEYL